MGDRAYVNLNIPLAHAEEVMALLREQQDLPNDQGPNDDETYNMGFEEVNNGNLVFLSELQRRGIAYNSSWGAGDEFSEGTQYLRFTPTGEAIKFDVYDTELDVIPISKLDPVFHAPNGTVQDLLRIVQQHVAAITPLPWDDQVAYGKVYRTRQLIEQ